MMKKIILISLLALFLLLTGCAEEIVKKTIEPTEMTVTIYFRGNVDSTFYRYYIIFSTTTGIKLPDINLPADPYFVIPGESYDLAALQTFTGDNDDIDYYYARYFYTWMDVTRYEVEQYYIVIPQGFYPTSATPNEHYSNYKADVAWSVQDMTGGNVLKVKFDIDTLKSGAATKTDNDHMYFNFVVVDDLAPGGSLGGLMYDYLESEPSIQNASGAQVSEYDASNDEAVPEGADIIRWTVQIK